MSKLIGLYTLNTCSCLYLNSASIELLKKKKNQKEGEVREKMGMCFQRQNRLTMEDHRHRRRENLMDRPLRKRSEITLHLGRAVH